MADVILPVLNEAAALPWVLDRIPSGFEPIVVDNGSSDGSGALAARLGARVVSREGGSLVLAFYNANNGPAWFRLTADPKTLRPRKLMMIAPAHFMHHSYFDVGKRPRIAPPTS